MTEPAPTQQEIIDEYVRMIMDKEPNMKQSEMRAMFACWAPSEIPTWFDASMKKEDRFFAWRWYFADQMLEWRDK